MSMKAMKVAKAAGAQPIAKEEAREEAAGAQQIVPAAKAQPKSAQQIKEEISRQLGDKVEKFRLAMKAVGKEDTPDLAELRGAFTAGEMSTLWARMKQTRGRDDMTIQEAWTDLNKQKGANVLKNECMYNFLVLPKVVWRERLLQLRERISFTKSATRLNEELTEGQLRQQHGADEAERLIAEGTFVEWGTLGSATTYKRVSKSTTQVAAHEKQIESTRCAAEKKQQQQQQQIK